MRSMPTIRILQRGSTPGILVSRGRGKAGSRKWLPRPGASPEALEAERAQIEAGIRREAAEGLSYQTAVSLYLESGVGHLAHSTLKTRRAILEGPLMDAFGALPLARIRRPEIMDWHGRALTAGVKPKTLLNHLDALSGLYTWAIDAEHFGGENPVALFRAGMKRGRGKQHRAAHDPARDIVAIEDPRILRELVAGAFEDGHETGLAVLLALDAGLRAGEVAGLRWQDVWLGGGHDDRSRSLNVCNNRPTGGRGDEAPKSGRGRIVAMSRRLRAALQERWLAFGQPSSGYVLRHPLHHSQPWDSAIFHGRLERVCKRRQLGLWRPKDLRSTYASQLLSAGVNVAYVSLQIGHAAIATTERHYARWLHGNEYREPERLLPGEVPADLIGRERDSRSSARASGGDSE